MAGDWIKMRADLFTHPKVVRISSALKADTLRTVGGLMSVWCLFDAHSADGVLEGYRAETLDDHLRWPGFAAAMMAVRWLSDDGESLALPEFDTHNGQSAKRRAQDADRKQAVRKMSAHEADKKRAREEKRREEIPSDRSSYPPHVVLEGVFEGHESPKPAEIAPATLAAIALRKAGLQVTGANPDLIAAMAEGVTEGHLLEVVANYPGKPPKYIISTARREHSEKAAPLNGNQNGSPQKLSAFDAARAAFDDQLNSGAFDHDAIVVG